MPFVTSWIGPFALRSSSLDREQGARSISGRVGLEVMEATPAGWRPYDHGPRSTVVGRLLVSDPLGAPSLGRTIELLAWLPEGPAPAGGSAVVYMHDGDNLFDDEASYAGEWKVDETLTAMGSSAVVVGIPNAGGPPLHRVLPMAQSARSECPRTRVRAVAGGSGQAVL
jgi:hypothetical protein